MRCFRRMCCRGLGALDFAPAGRAHQYHCDQDRHRWYTPQRGPDRRVWTRPCLKWFPICCSKDIPPFVYYILTFIVGIRLIREEAPVEIRPTLSGRCWDRTSDLYRVNSVHHSPSLTAVSAKWAYLGRFRGMGASCINAVYRRFTPTLLHGCCTARSAYSPSGRSR